jgi:NAD(P)-dependent dehydrogenase (short-subunit alcohol dehydrogenase family)
VSVAVITGSRGGIGSATAAAFEAAGFDVHGVDVGDEFPDLERLDALVCTHGISGRSLGDGPVDACTEEAWDAVLDANLKSVFLYAKRALGPLSANGARSRWLAMMWSQCQLELASPNANTTTSGRTCSTSFAPWPHVRARRYPCNVSRQA